MSNKYYAVKVGRNPGIYMTWDECKEQVNKYPKAEFKSFTTMEEAHAFMENKTVEVEIDSKDTAVAYVDGSFSVETNEYGYGAVVFCNGEEIHLSGKGSQDYMISMRNVAGEIIGSRVAMEFAIEKKCEKLIIYHDYEGINNIKTINDNAGVAPVEVSQEIIDLLLLNVLGLHCYAWAFSRCGVQASHCSGFYFCRAWPLGLWAQ